MTDKTTAAPAATGATAMPVLLATLIPALLQAGIQLAPLVAALIETQTRLQQANRPDVSDADMASLRGVIVGLQASIDAQAAAAASAPIATGTAARALGIPAAAPAAGSKTA